MRTNRISRGGALGCAAQKSRAAWRAMAAPWATGKPKMPVLMDGKAIEAKPWACASCRALP